MPDPSIILKIARALGQATNKRGVGMVGPLAKGLADDPEVLSLLQAADKYAGGFSPNVLSQAAAERSDLLQSAMTHFKRGMKPPEAATAAKRGIDEFLAAAQDKMAKYGTQVQASESTIEKVLHPKGAIGSTGLGEKAQEVYELASPRLKAYLDHVLDPSKPYPNIGRKALETELQVLRQKVGEPRLVAPEKRSKGPRGHKKPKEVSGPGLETESLVEPADVSPESLHQPYKSLFSEERPPKLRRSLKDEVSPE